ncbi:GNAT family N-acetyltransferase [Asticcacaulis sp. AND118]|uniref:GNAT family N-acetyltransferase n=1 Tax=Asticcacaulis sp. AND118 TaxID=2840468 RepID=UPI001CFF6171|nr:GNAT family N-acetyltransferase [Asticcacaulis sp. AND118]UDF04232.1 GNAT family N-acetyltransferase [Asticcacaulis sp. AND118]
MTTRIFAATLDDLPRVQAMARVIWPECFAGILPPERIGPMVEVIYALDTLRADITERGHRYWLAQVDGEDAGYVSAYQEGERLWLKKLYLRDICRGRGTGKALINTILAAFPDARELALYVNDGNAPAIAFYQSQGFEIEATVSVQMGPFPFTDHIMRKPL